MFKSLEFFIGMRYTGAKRRNHFISFISFASIAGIALGATVMITVMSVMNGFQHEVRERILGVASHVTITGIDRRLTDWQSLSATVTKHPHVIGVAPFIRAEGMLTNGQQVNGVLVRGVLPGEEPNVSIVGDSMVKGSLDDLKPGKYNIILGFRLARILGARVGSKVTLVTPQIQVTPAGILPRLKRFTVVGMFKVGHNEYDSGLALIHLQDAAKVFRYGEEVTGLRVKLDDIFLATRVGRELVSKLHGGFIVNDWTQYHRTFFRAVQIEKRMMFIILVLIIAVAAFNIVSTMVMVVTDKESDIAILRTLGASPASIMRIFMIQGTIIGFLGTLIGATAGVLLSYNVETIVGWIETTFGIKFLAADVYLITELPSDLHWNDVAGISIVAFLLTLIATFYPAWRAARVQPAEALRYE